VARGRVSKTIDRHGDGGVGPGEIIVMVMPEQHGDPALGIARGQHAHIRLAAHAFGHDRSERQLRAAGCGQFLITELREHPEYVEHRQVHAVRGELAIACKPGLVLEFE
jgi:hypothetical protein